MIDTVLKENIKCKLTTYELKVSHLKRKGYISYTVKNNNKLMLGNLLYKSFDSIEDLRQYVFFKLAGPLELKNETGQVILYKDN